MNALLSRVVYWIVAPLHDVLHATGIAGGPLALKGFESIRWNLGRLGVWIRFHSTRMRVPAYRDFVRANCDVEGWQMRRVTDFPVVDKTNYIKPFSLESRCVGGVLPTRGLIIDESSGSSGVPTNWVRGASERAANGRTIHSGLIKRLGRSPLFFINAFALGPWATGINLTLSLSRWARVKSLGPDLTKIINTLTLFGPKFHYVIMGYPPFLKQLLDRDDVVWSDHHVSLIFGGEGMGESMRRYLQSRGVSNVFGSYGASDLELNIAAETDFTIALRRLLENDTQLAQQLLKHAGALPMIFQYNPADFYIESNVDGELLVTICRPNYVAPKVRYNIHDLGHVVRFPVIRELLRKRGISTQSLDAHALDLPLMFHYGRSDMSVAYYGCKIPPADIQEALFRLPNLAQAIDAFQLRATDDEHGDKRLVVHLEVRLDHSTEPPAHVAQQLFDSLSEVNQDFRESRRMVAAQKQPAVELHAHGTGPFANADIRIKRTYIR